LNVHNVHSANGVKEAEMYTAEPLVTEPSSDEVGICCWKAENI